MNFNEEQSEVIYEFIIKYNSDEDFKSSVEKQYNNEVEKLSMLQIYALEEVLRYGNKCIFTTFQETLGSYTLAEAINLFDSFIKLLNEDENFKQYKLEQLKHSKETLSEMEILVFELFNKDNKQDEQTNEKNQSSKLEYDKLNPIRYATDNQIRKTLEDLLFGKFIHLMLELPEMLDIKNRQKESGVIANSDKSLIINEIRKLLENDFNSFQQTVDYNFIRVKYQILLGKKEEAFSELLQYNTNISADEILGREKDNSEEDAYQFFKDIINDLKK